MEDSFDTLKYNIEIDEQSLAQELEKVRDQMDIAMGSLAFSGLPSDPGGISSIPQSGIYAAPDISGLMASPLAGAENSF